MINECTRRVPHSARLYNLQSGLCSDHDGGLFAYVAGKLLSLRSLLCAVLAESVDNEVIINATGFLITFFKLNIYTVVQKSKKAQHTIKLGDADIFL